jgi:tetratricopeptide (TPR) repeat protein
MVLFFPLLGLAQEPPRAVPVDPGLERNPGRDWYQHGRNVYESAKRSSGPERDDLYQRAVEIFSRYLNDFPEHENAEAAWWYLGEAHYAGGRIEDAKRCYHTLLNRYGRGRYAAAAAYKLGADHFNNRQYALAATLFEKLARIGTDAGGRMRGRFYAGKSHELLGRDRQAAEHFKAVLDDDSTKNNYRGKAGLGYGSIIADDGKLEEALDVLDEVVGGPFIPETRGAAALKAGAVAARLGDRERSDRYFDFILSTPGMEAFRPDAQIAMMAARFDQKRYDEVIRIFNRSTSPGKGDREARRLMLAARAYMMTDRNADALQLFREVERLMPSDSTFAFDATYYRLLCFYRIEGRHVLDQVEAFLELYADRHPRDPKIHTAQLMKAETLFAERKFQEAADVYRDIDPAMLSEKNRRGLLYQRGRCLAEANDHEGAIRSLTEFLDGNPDDRRRDLALAARARALAATGANTRALADFDRLIEETDDRRLRTLGLLEGARIAKAENELPTMIERYLSFLESAPASETEQIAKASYWTGWGMVKTDRGPEAKPYLERARELAPERYAKHAGLLLSLVLLAEKDADALIAEVGTAITEGYAGELPEPLVRWAADQAYNGDNFTDAARFYDLIADEENPDLVARRVWRFLAKARIRSGDPSGALRAIGHLLEGEQDPGWRADALTDRGRALLMLDRPEEAMEAAEQGLGLGPEGRVGAALHLLRGDILIAQDNAEEAVRAYVLPVELMDDRDRVVKPEALHKLIKALKQVGKFEDAAKYQEELDRKYPDWEPADE